ncbi:MAG: 30S ribosomal protein S6 [Thermodesulfobacteriota bacterium]|nr:30S ribosomal protein S6 [Thermodesulfobacteriota bacterium]
MRRYETITIIKANIAEDEIDTILDRMGKIIQEENGEVLKVDKWGLRKLAYLIKKEQQGHYVLTEYAGTPAAVNEMERIFKIDERILKYMTIKLQDVYIADEPSEDEDQEESDQEEIETDSSEAEVPEAVATDSSEADVPEADAIDKAE